MATPKIFYFCYAHNRPTGGQKHTYCHVDALNRKGIEAFAFHPRDNFRLTWFANNTRVIGWSKFLQLHNSADDFVVLPEDLGESILKFPGRKVIFNKGLFYGFQCLGLNSDKSPYLAHDVVAVMTISEHNHKHLQFAYPHLHIERVYPAIRPEIFQFRPLRLKRPQIAFVLKGPRSFLTLYHTIQARATMGFNRVGEFRWMPLGDKSESETAQILQESLLFLFTSFEEGLARLPLEAMACGCLVGAYFAGPLRETLPSEYGFEPGDILSLVRFVEHVVDSFPDRLSIWDSSTQRGLSVAQKYSVERQDASVNHAWSQILAHAQRRKGVKLSGNRRAT